MVNANRVWMRKKKSRWWQRWWGCWGWDKETQAICKGKHLSWLLLSNYQPSCFTSSVPYLQYYCVRDRIERGQTFHFIFKMEKIINLLILLGLCTLGCTCVPPYPCINQFCQFLFTAAEWSRRWWRWWRWNFLDRKSTRLNSSHTVISYAVFCLKKKTYHPILFIQ